MEPSGLDDLPHLYNITPRTNTWIVRAEDGKPRLMVHDRMPVIVQPKDRQRWLDPENEDAADIIAPPPFEGWIAYPVSRRVNSPKTEDAKLIEPELLSSTALRPRTGALQRHILKMATP